MCSFFSELKYRGNKTYKGKKTKIGGSKLKLLLLFQCPATTERKTSQLSLKLCAQQGPKSHHRQMDEDAGKKKTADSRQWFKWQKAKAIQLTIYINEIPDLPKVLEQLAKHRRKAPALFNSNPLKMQLQSCNWQSLQSWAGHPPKIHPQKKNTQIHQIPNANNNHLRKFRFLVSKRRHKHATFSEASWIKAILWSCFKLGVTGTNNNRGFNIGVS